MASYDTTRIKSCYIFYSFQTVCDAMRYDFTLFVRRWLHYKMKSIKNAHCRLWNGALRIASFGLFIGPDISVLLVFIDRCAAFSLARNSMRQNVQKKSAAKWQRARVAISKQLLKTHAYAFECTSWLQSNDNKLTKVCVSYCMCVCVSIYSNGFRSLNAIYSIHLVEFIDPIFLQRLFFRIRSQLLLLLLLLLHLS